MKVQYENENSLREAMICSIAKVCHEANKAFCEINGDLSQKNWDEAEEWQRKSAENGVRFRLDNPNAGHDAQHNSWMKEKIDQGWVYGEVKDAEKKTHPCILPFEQLPLFQQQKDALFCAIVDSLAIVEKQQLNSYEHEVVSNKQLRKDIDNQIQKVKDLPGSRERSIAITKLQEGVMWLGMDLKRLGEQNPYPDSKNPESGTKIEPTAEGLKL